MKASRHIPWRAARIAAQAICLLLFLWLFRRTEYTGTSEIPWAANLLFRLDPLIAASVLLAGKWVVTSVVAALVIVVLTLLLGRFFCGWICPMGTLLDAARWLGAVAKRGWRRIRGASTLSHPMERERSFRVTKYALLAVILVGAVFGLPLVGYFDPFTILVRGMTCALDPLWYRGTAAVFDWLYREAPAAVTSVSEPVYAFLKRSALPFQQTRFVAGSLSLAILAGVFALELVGRRFWCRSLCPLGAMLSLLSRWSIVRRLPLKACTDCRLCAETCRMDAFDRESRLRPEECTLCMDCVEDCPHERARFLARKPKPAPIVFEPSRRAFLTTFAAAFTLPAVAWAGRRNRMPHPKLIRPPGALDEEAFLEACVRCGECLKVCPTNALQPTMFEAGIEGVFSPRLVPRIGWCEFNCTLCGELCPTGALARLAQPEKHRAVMGKAQFDKERCLPFAKGKPCIVCEEHCPVPTKAIRFREAEVMNENGEQVTVKQPYLEFDLCTGCGICETRCPVAGESAVQVVRVETARRDGFQR